MTSKAMVRVRNTRVEDFRQIIELSRRVYSNDAWREEQLASHLRIFPEGQFVAVQEPGKVVGMAASLIVNWDDYNLRDNWRDFTEGGMFTNHDPDGGRTLYGAEVMVDTDARRGGIGSKLYQARRDLAKRLNLRRIRAASRLRGYHRYSSEMSAEQYVVRVVRGELDDPTLSFQLYHGFEVIAVVSGYLTKDPESLGYAAVIEWANPHAVSPEDLSARDPMYRAPRPNGPKGGQDPAAESSAGGDAPGSASVS
jgi:ribosomal protein S18 acetylase RimI-like enzyme